MLGCGLPAQACLLLSSALGSLVQVGTAITVISIVAVQLSNVSTIQEFAGSLDDSVKTCLLSSDPTNGSVCNYAYLVGGLSIGLTVVIGILQVSAAIWPLCAASKWLTSCLQTKMQPMCSSCTVSRPAVQRAVCKQALQLQRPQLALAVWDQGLEQRLQYHSKACRALMMYTEPPCLACRCSW